MQDLEPTDILTRVSRYNLIRRARMIYIDVHQALKGTLAGNFVAVPNLVNIVARQDYQGVGATEQEALQDCLSKIKGVEIDVLFPTKSEKD